MGKTNGGVRQSFSLRRLILQRASLTENHRTQRINDVENGENKPKTFYKAQIDLRNSYTVDPSSSQLTELQSPGDIADMYCIICYLKESAATKFFTLELCNHKFCISCLEKYLKNEINESRTDVACPQCSFAIHPNNIECLLKNFPEYKIKYEDFMIRRYLVTDPDSRWCPAPDCNYAVIATGCASCPQLKCERPNCGLSFCYHCKAEWHPDQTCDTARIMRQKVLGTSSLNYSHDSIRRDDIKACPRCQVLIVKMNDGSCNHMICSVCGAEFCWLCLKEVSDLHYLSPSGCTFWGKKPWSRKKKIVWQIGTLIGAPVGIALLAGIAIPSMVIGIPLWVGRKLLDRYKTKTKHKKNVSVIIGVTVSILISPILAGLAIAIGVPILLFYVYGIVPVSLCRAGCSTSTEDYKYDINIPEMSHDSYNTDGASLDAVSRIEETSIGDISLNGTSETVNKGITSMVTNNDQYNREPMTGINSSEQNINIEYAGGNGAGSTFTEDISKVTDTTPKLIAPRLLKY